MAFGYLHGCFSSNLVFCGGITIDGMDFVMVWDHLYHFGWLFGADGGVDVDKKIHGSIYYL